MPIKIRSTEASRAWGDGYGNVVIEEYFQGEIFSFVTISIEHFKKFCDAYDRLHEEALHGVYAGKQEK
jgi:phosphoribosylamine-glycine ligase